MKRRIRLICSIDTEEDNWVPARTGVTATNIRRLPDVHTFLTGLGLRPTYFVNFAASQDPAAGDVFASLREAGNAELGAHLHPWNTPPLRDDFELRSTMLNNISRSDQRAKLDALTRALVACCGEPPRSFRAGRFGLGPETIRALGELGYRYDSSVTPHIDWTDYAEGPDFRGAPLTCYRPDGTRDVRRADPDGQIVEVPVSSGFTRRPFQLRSRVHRWVRRPWPRRFLLASITSRSEIARVLLLAPELYELGGLVALAEALAGEGVSHLNFYLHSPSFSPGLTPYSDSEADVDVLKAKVGRLVEALDRRFDIAAATVAEVGAAEIPHLDAAPDQSRAASRSSG